MAELGAELETVRDSPRKVAKGVLTQVREDDVPFMAGSIAYQAFASLIPLLVLLFIVVTLVGDQQLAQRVVALTEGVLPNSAQDLVRNAILSDGSGAGTASLIGLVTIVWGSLKIFRGLDKAFSEIYETGAENSIGDQLKDGVIVLTALGLGVIGMVGAMSVFAVFGALSQVVSFLALIVGLTLAFLPMYKLFPDADLEWADALPGAVIAAVGWVGLQFLFQLYIQFSSKGDSSGVLGAVLLLLLWLYFSGLVLLLAAVVNAVLLGEGEPEPRLSEDRKEELADQLHRERDRRQSLEHERARLRRELERTETESAASDVGAVRQRNRALERRLQWLERPLYTRLGLRLFGAEPPTVPEPVPRQYRYGGADADGTESV